MAARTIDDHVEFTQFEHDADTHETIHPFMEASGGEEFVVARTQPMQPTRRIHVPHTDPELPAGAVAVAPEHDLIHRAMRRVHYTNVSKKRKTLEAHNQESQHRCVAAAMCTAMLIRAIMSTKGALQEALCRDSNKPSVAYAYHRQRVMECRANARCKCGKACGSLCDNCGSLLTVMQDAGAEGIATESAWPIAEYNNIHRARAANNASFLASRPYFRVTGKSGFQEFAFRVGDATQQSADMVRQIQTALKNGFPIIINMKVYPSQVPFFQQCRQATSKSTSSAASSAASKSIPTSTQLPWWHARFQLPPPLAREACNKLGHAMLIIGSSAAHAVFRVRNSAGAEWGCNGDLAIPFSALTPRQVSALVAVRRVDVINKGALCVV